MKFTKLVVIGLFVSSQAFAFGTDGCDSKSQVLSHFDGPDAQASATEDDCDGNGKKTFTFAGDAQLDNSQLKFGLTSLQLDGTGDYISMPDDPDWDIGTKDFSYDFWVRFNSVLLVEALFEMGRFPDGIYCYFNNGTGGIHIGIEANDYFKAWSPANNTWYHIAVTRTGSDVKLFIDGVQTGATTTDAADVNAPSTGFFIGAFSDASSPLNGRIDEFRFSNGKAHFSSAFTPPTTPYCRGCEMMQVLQ